MRTLYVSVLAALVTLPCLAQTRGSGRITISDPRPVAMGAAALEGHLGWVVTYEDPQWLATTDIQDVTESVRQDVPTGLRGLAPRVLVPKGGTFELNITPQTRAIRGVDRLAVVQGMLMSHFSAGNPGMFRVQETHGRLNIVPLTAKGASGMIEAQQPILDTAISLDEREWNGLSLLQAIAEQLTRATGVEVVAGTSPVNTFAHHKGIYGAQNETARDFLSRFLDRVGPGYSWQLFFDPGDRMYVLNIHSVASAKGEE